MIQAKRQPKHPPAAPPAPAKRAPAAAARRPPRAGAINPGMTLSQQPVYLGRKRFFRTVYRLYRKDGELRGTVRFGPQLYQAKFVGDEADLSVQGVQGGRGHWVTIGGSARQINPEDGAAAMFEEFHGRPPDRFDEFTEDVRYHGNLAALGSLIEMTVVTVSGLEATIAFEPGSRPLLAANEDGTQLYIVGGDQSLDLGRLRLDSSRWQKDNMVIGVLVDVVYETAKHFDKFRLLEYEHRLGEETGHEPLLLYDTLNQKLSVAGGQYQIRQEGIRN